MSIREINFLLSDISEISELIPLVIGIVLKIRKQPYVMIVYLFAFSAPLKLASLITAKLSIHNFGLFHFLAVCEIVLLFSFYSRILSGKVNFIGVAILVVLNILNMIFIENFTEFNSIAWSFNTLVLLCMCLMVFYRMFTALEATSLEKDPTFVITSAWLVYCSGALFTYVLGSKILSQEARGMFHNAWIIQSLSNIAKNTVICFGLWLARYH